MDWTKLITESTISTILFAGFIFLFTKHYEKKDIILEKIGMQVVIFFLISMIIRVLFQKVIN